jgi:D-inositol-3-phosphate glycosyltransferase
MNVKGNKFRIAMLSIHSSPMGELGSQDTGGMSVYIRELARELGSAGHKIDIYTKNEKGIGDKVVTLNENVHLIHLNMGDNGTIPKGSLYPHLPDIFRSLDTFRMRNDLTYDLVHSHYWLSGRVGVMAQRSWNVPHIVMFHTTGIAKRVSCADEKEMQLRLVDEKKLAHECSRIIAPTEKEKLLLGKYFAVPLEKIACVPCGVNPDTFQPLPKQLARDRTGLQKFNPLLLYVGRLAPVKGVERLMAAMIHMRKYDNLRLIIAGGDGHQSGSTVRLRKCARKLGIHNTVIFTGRIAHEDLSLYYSAADVLVMPSYYESFGLVALESLACGTPVVATRTGAMDSIINKGTTGAIVDFPSPQGIASAIEKVLEQKARKSVTPDVIRTSVMGHKWKDIASAVADEYKALIPDDWKKPRSQREQEVVCGITY